MKMQSLQNLVLVLGLILNCVTSTAQLIIVSGYEGHAVNMSCSYSEGYESYEKYLCRSDCGDVLVTTTSKKKNRYSISDDRQKRILTTTISDLSSADGGQYWCGVTRTGNDLYSELKLKVGKDSCCDQPDKHQGYEESSVSFSCPYASKDQNSLKYICRGRQPSSCLQQALTTSDDQQQGRISLTDNKQLKKFTVTITSLTLEDSGSYLCGVQRKPNLDSFTAVDVEVKEWCCEVFSQQSGIVGKPFTFQCPYSPQHRDNRKFICKGNQRKHCTDMMSNGRFSLQDNVSSSSFFVRVTELKAEDAGMYWCGSDPQWRVGNYTKIQLSVDFQHQTSTVGAAVESKPTSLPHKNLTAHFLSVGVMLPTVCVILLLTLTLSSVILCKYKCRKVEEAGVQMRRNQTKKAEEDDVISVTDLYENHDVVVLSSKRTSKRLSTHHQDDDDSVYQNCASMDEIYCNEVYVTKKAKK